MIGNRIRKIKNTSALVLCSILASAGLFWLMFILWDILVQGISYINFDLFFNDPAPPGEGGGGLRNAFFGHFLITGGALAIGIPVGVLGGTFLAEYGRFTRIGRLISNLSDIMLSVPTLVIGSFVYILFVRPFSHYNGWAGSLALAIILIPVVLRTTEDMMRQIPWHLREAAFALGATYHSIIMKIVYKGAISGILTGIMLSVARIAGEAAPLLFTAFNSSFFTTDMNNAMPSLTVTIFQYALGPFDEKHGIAWAASFVIVCSFLIITIIARIIMSHRLNSKGFSFV